MRKHYRQGDILLVQVDNLPTGLSQEQHEVDLVLAAGELTGHAHTVDLDHGTIWCAGEEVRFLEALNGAVLTHQEHAAIALDPGVYCIQHQREYHPEAIRRVAD